MREGLMSGSLRKKGEKDSLGEVKIPDLNIKHESDVVSGEEGGDSCVEVRKNDGKSNGSLWEGEGFVEGKVVGVEVENEGVKGGSQGVDENRSERKEVEGGLEGQVGNVDGSLLAENERGDVVKEEKESGLEGVTCAVNVSDQALASTLAAHEGGSVMEKNLGSDTVDETGGLIKSNEKMDVVEGSGCEFDGYDRSENLKTEARDGRVQVFGKVLRSRIVPASGSVEDSSGGRKRRRGFNGRGEEAVAAKGENDKSADDTGRMYTRQGINKSVDHAEEQTVEIGEVKVASKAEDEDAGCKSVSTLKKKDGRGRPRKYVQETVEMDEVKVVSKAEDKDSGCKSVSTLKKKDGRGRPRKYVEGTVEMDEIKVASKAEYEDAGFKSSSSLKKKDGRGRPRKNVVCSEENVMNKVQVVSESEVLDLNSKSREKGKRGRPKKTMGCSVEEGIQMSKLQVVSEVEDEDSKDKSVRSSKKKGKRGRPRKLFNSPGKEAMVDEVEEDAGHISSRSIGSSKQERKRGRPKKSVDFPEEEIVQTKRVPFCEVDDEDADVDADADEDIDVSNKSVRNPRKKGKRGRPKRQEGNSAAKMDLHDKGKINDDRKMKVSLVTAPVRRTRLDTHGHRTPDVASDEVPSLKGISVDKKNNVNTSPKGEHTPKAVNNVPGKRKRVETAGSTTAEKNSIRKRIVDMLLSAGWTVEYRPRHGRDYNDAVYVNRDGKTHWSVTKAYNTLKQEVEEGKVGSGAAKSKFCFTPIPEEVLGKLFRVVSKTRSDKNKKKKHKYDDGDVSDEEFIRDKGKTATKHRLSAAKRKPSFRDGTQSKRRCALLVRRSNQGSNSEGDVSIAHCGKHSVLSWMIDSGTVALDGKVNYMNRSKTKSLLEGSITRDGIHCSCCKKVISVSEFENHAGTKLCEPYENVCIEGGVSLLQCQLDSWNKQEETGRTGFHSVLIDGDDPNDDTCGICGDGGDLVCCDSCPSTFHHDCLNLEEVPSGEWRCVYCSCKFCGDSDESTSEMDDDFDSSSPSLVTCSLCDEKYHQSCIDEVDAVCVPNFCGRNCEQIYDRLQSLLGAKHDLGDGFSWTLLQRTDVTADAITVKPQKILSNSKLAVALSVMDECFLPILDPRSGINLIRHIVYNCGSNFNRLNFSNFCTVVLERGEEVISAASIRIHAKGLAEMPFIGTRNVYRRQGMCRRLLNAIEMALGSLDVEKLVIPAIPELLDTWTSVFGFKPLEELVKAEMRSMSMLVFPHTGMLQKSISKEQLVEKTIAINEDDVKCPESGNELEEDVKCPESGNELVHDKADKSDGWMNGTFDLNSVAPDQPESSTDERHLAHCSTSENCEYEVKSGTDLGGAIHENKVEGQSIPEEKDDLQPGPCALVPNSTERKAMQPDLNHENKVEGRSTPEKDDIQPGPCALVPNSTERKAMQPDLNLTDEIVCDSENPDIPTDEKSHVNHCSVTLNLKNTEDSLGLANGDDSVILENASEINLDANSAEATKPCDFQRFSSGETMQPSSVTGCQEVEVGCSKADTSDAHELGTLGLGVVECEDVSVKVKSPLKCTISEMKEEYGADGTIVGAQLPTKSIETQVEFPSITPISSETCNLGSGVPGIFHGNGIPEVGSSK